MKKLLFIPLLFTFFLFQGCEKVETISGEITDYTPIRPGIVARVLGAQKGYIYMIKNNADNKHYGIFFGEDVLRVGDVGSFVLGDRKYSARFKEKIENGGSIEYKDQRMNIYELKAHELTKRGKKHSFVKTLLKGFTSKFKGFLLDKAF